MAKIRENWGENSCQWTLKVLLAKLMREKNTSMHFGSLVMTFKSIIDFTKKVPSLMSFATSSAFNDSLGVECHTYRTCEWSVGSQGGIDSETMFIGSS